jgi:hypothetical protein
MRMSAPFPQQISEADDGRSSVLVILRRLLLNGDRRHSIRGDLNAGSRSTGMNCAT